MAKTTPPWSCKLLPTGLTGQELVVFLSWHDTSFSLLVVDHSQRVWGRPGAPRRPLRMLRRFRHCWTQNKQLRATASRRPLHC